MYMPSTDGRCEFSLFVEMAIVIYQPFQAMKLFKNASFLKLKTSF